MGIKVRLHRHRWIRVKRMGRTWFYRCAICGKEKYRSEWYATITKPAAG